MTAIKGNIRCSSLNASGKQCSCKAITKENYHGSPELYGYLSDRPVSWVRVFFCKKHSKKGSK